MEGCELDWLWWVEVREGKITAVEKDFVKVSGENNVVFESDVVGDLADSRLERACVPRVLRRNEEASARYGCSIDEDRVSLRDLGP